MDQARRSIALVEDDPAEVEMLKLALREAGFEGQITVFQNGADILDYVGQTVPGRASFDLMLLDLNLPRIGGLEVLERIRSMAFLKSLPIVILSGSKNSVEIEHCYALGANSYISKSSRLADILCMADQLLKYWFQCVQLPSRSSSRAGGFACLPDRS